MNGDNQLEQQAALQAYRDAAKLYKAQEFEQACEMLERLAKLYPNHETVRSALTMCETALAKKAALDFARSASAGNAFPADVSLPEDEDATPLPDEAPTPVPFDLPVAQSEESDNEELKPGLPLAAIVLGAVVGIAIGMFFSGPGDAPMEGATLGPVALPSLVGLRDDLSSRYPGALDLSIVDAVMSNGAGNVVMSAGTAGEHGSPWTASPVWVKDGLRYWESSWGEFYEYRPETIADYSYITIILPPAPPSGVSAADVARACIEDESIRYYSDRTGYPVISLVVDTDRYPEYGRGELSSSLSEFVDQVYVSAALSLEMKSGAPILLGIGVGGSVASRSDRIDAVSVVACQPVPVTTSVRDDVPITVIADDSHARHAVYEGWARDASNIELDIVENGDATLGPMLTASLPHLVP